MTTADRTAESETRARGRRAPRVEDAARLRRVVESRVEALFDTLPQALNGSIEAVHDARVASRRVREGLALVAAGPAHRRAAKARRRVRRVGRVLGRVRELDAALALLDEMAAGRPALMGEVQAAKGGLADARRRKARALDDLSGRFERKLRRVLTDLLDKFAAADEATDWHTAVSRQIARRRRRLVRAMREAGVTASPADLHAVRVAVKRLRYSVELGSELSGNEPRRALAQLKRAQDVLGRLRDLHVLDGRLRDLDDGARFDRMRAVAEASIRALHRDYLARRDELRRAAAALASAGSTLWVHPHR